MASPDTWAIVAYSLLVAWGVMFSLAGRVDLPSMWYIPRSRFKRGALLLVITSLFSFLNRPSKSEICFLALAQALVLAYGLSDYLKKGRRNLAAFLLVFSIGATCLTLIAWHFWPTLSIEPRIRVLDVVPVPTSQSGAPFPAMNIYYDNAGTDVATGVVNHFAAGFGGTVSDNQTLAEQDKILRWDGWKDAMAKRAQHELHPGDPGEYTSIPNTQGQLAKQFADNWHKVEAGTATLQIILTFKYFNRAGKTQVTEYCFWFSGNFARHTCGRGRTFTEE